MEKLTISDRKSPLQRAIVRIFLSVFYGWFHEARDRLVFLSQSVIIQGLISGAMGLDTSILALRLL